MTNYSNLFKRYYDANNVIYISNLVQVHKYLNASEEVSKCLVDILYSGTRNDCLVFVFEKTDIMKELYEKWKNHELN